MELEQLETFILVSKYKNFTRTAENLYIAQSTVTNRIKMLEGRLGKPLFERDKRHVKLTSFGKTLLPYAERIIELVNEGERITKLKGIYEDHLVIGSLHALWEHVLFPYINDFYRLNPQFTFRFITGHSNDIVQKITDGIIDVGFVYLPPRGPDVVVVPLYDDSIHLIGHPSLALDKNKDIISIQDLTHIPYIHMNWGDSFSEWYQEEVGRYHIDPFQVDNISLLIKFITTGNGIGFLLDSISRPLIQQGILKHIPFYSKVPLPKRTTYLIYRKKNENLKALQKWVDFILKIKAVIC
jgi:DNA-binding transcriptional LysR family regulator